VTVSTRLDTVHVYRDSLGEWRWRRRAPGGRTLSESPRGYQNRRDAITNLRTTHGYHHYTLMTGTE
jgi:uncharacterized protein YegP (UPF0339 family)